MLDLTKFEEEHRGGELSRTVPRLVKSMSKLGGWVILPRGQLEPEARHIFSVPPVPLLFLVHFVLVAVISLYAFSVWG